jgi:hypothetical protein
VRDAGKAGLRTHRPVLSIGRDANEDDAGIELLEVVVTEAPFFQGAGPEILDHDVALGGKLPEQVAAAFAQKIECHAFLVAGFRKPHQRIAALGVGAEPP